MGTQIQEPVFFYERQFYMFSNFSAFAVIWQGQKWMTSEHAYQAAKFTDPIIQDEIRNALSAYAAKKVARSFDDQRRPDWAEVKLGVMEDILRAKLAQHAHIQTKLRETGAREIIEDSPTDSFWGCGPDHRGQNHLGKLWMKLRAELLKW